MTTGIFYVRIIPSRVPENHKILELFSEDQNYPVLGLDSAKNRILLHDRGKRLHWVPMGLFDFVKLG